MIARKITVNLTHRAAEALDQLGPDASTTDSVCQGLVLLAAVRRLNGHKPLRVLREDGVVDTFVVL